MNKNQLGKIPPQAIEMEEAVLGALMLEKDAILSVMSIISPDKFYKDSHRVIFKAILELFTGGEPIDLLTVITKLRKKGNLELAGGLMYITELTSKVSSGANIEYHSRIIAEQSMKRMIIAMASKAQVAAYSEEVDVFELIDQISSDVLNISSSVNESKSETVRSIMPSVIDNIKKASEDKNNLTGIDTGYPLVNQLTGGWQDTNLIIIAARPSIGKSDLAINLTINASLTGKKVALFSLEMSGNELVKRIISITTEIYRDKIKNGRLTDSDWSQIMKMRTEVLDNIIIQDNPSLNTIKLHSSCKNLKLKYGIDMVVLDYLQLMSSVKKGGTRENEVSEISRSCKVVAGDIKVPFIALSQLSRAVELRGGDKKPILSDLRESGSIENDANLVIFPYRAEKYGIMQDEEGNSTENIMELIFAKHRDGGLGNIKTKYVPSIGKVYSIDENIKDNPKYNPDKFISSGQNDFDDAAPF